MLGKSVRSCKGTIGKGTGGKHRFARQDYNARGTNQTGIRIFVVNDCQFVLSCDCMPIQKVVHKTPLPPVRVSLENALIRVGRHQEITHVKDAAGDVLGTKRTWLHSCRALAMQNLTAIIIQAAFCLLSSCMFFLFQVFTHLRGVVSLTSNCGKANHAESPICSF